jgi:hypothetical protein
VGVHIHGLKNSEGRTCVKGTNPFDGFTLKNGTEHLSSVVKVYDQIGSDSAVVYRHIKDNLEKWIQCSPKNRAWGAKVAKTLPVG